MTNKTDLWCVYVQKCNGVPFYVGLSKSRRRPRHLGPGNRSKAYRDFVKDNSKGEFSVAITYISNEIEARQMETSLIRVLEVKHNLVNVVGKLSNNLYKERQYCLQQQLEEEQVAVNDLILNKRRIL